MQHLQDQKLVLIEERSFWINSEKISIFGLVRTMSACVLDIKRHLYIVETQKKMNKKVVLCFYEQKA